jgi:hypothetical protein
MSHLSDDPLWWLSFVDPDKTPRRAKQRPGGVSFLGVAIVQARDGIAAINRAWVLGVNPGGQVATWGPIPPKTIDSKWCHRLLTAKEAEAVPFAEEAP